MSFLQVIVRLAVDFSPQCRKLTVNISYSEIFPYPCVLSFAFVKGKLSNHPVYPKILESAKNGDTVFLDVGCCSKCLSLNLLFLSHRDTTICAVGTDARRLVFDGYPASNVLGCDLRQSYIDQGHELYQDSNTCQIRFFTSDVFDIPARPAVATNALPLSDVTTFSELQNRVTHMYTALLFHLFDEASQFAIAIRVATLLRKQSGAVVFGRHQGMPRASLITDNFFR
jgi:hypothetical protein